MNYLEVGRDNDQEDDESLAIRGLETPIVRMIINKAIRYYQGLILLETAYCIVYHIRLDVSRDICSKPYGFVIMLLIREFTCPVPAGFPSKLLLVLLDILLLFCQIVIINGLTEFESSERETYCQGVECRRRGRTQHSQT